MRGVNLFCNSYVYVSTRIIQTPRHVWTEEKNAENDQIQVSRDSRTTS